MIGSLRGVLLDKAARSANSAEVIVETNGVGYRLMVTAASAERVGPVGSPVFLHVHTHVREDALVLYGFASRDERACFEALIGARGVGPSVALALLSIHSPASLQRAVMSGDADALSLVPGIGAKTAARLLVELKSRLGADGALPGLHPVAESDGGPAAVLIEVRGALAGLGYAADEIRAATAGLEPDGTVEDNVRRALGILAAAR